MFPLASLPDTATRIVLQHLTLKDKKNLRLVSSWFSFKICSLSPTLRRWKIVILSENYKCIREILQRVAESQKGHLRYRLNIVFHPSMTRSAEAKEFTKSVLTQWKDDIAGLELPVLGEETYLLEPDLKFPNLEQINLKVQDYWDSGNGLHQIEDIRKCLLIKHASQLTKLDFHNAYKLSIESSFPRLVNLCLNNCDIGTVISILNTCSNKLNGLEMFQCFGDEEVFTTSHLSNLEHLWIESCDHLCTGLVQQLASQLVTLKIRATDIYLYKAMFLKLEFLWIENVSNEVALSLLGRCSKTVKHLFIRGIYSSPETAMVVPHLTDLIVDGKGPWCMEIVKKNAATLKFLAVLYPGRNLQSLTCNFQELQILLLPDLEDIDTISRIKSQCLKENVKIIVTRTSVCEAVQKYAKQNFLFYKAAEDLQKRGYF